MRAGNLGVPTTSEWLNEILAPGCRVGIDPFLFSFDAAEDLKEKISKKSHKLVYVSDSNLVDKIWKESRPMPPKKPIRVHDINYAGVDITSKLSSLRSQLTEAGASAIVISMLDEIAWLLNLRGNDVPHSPVAYAYLIVEISNATLFIDKSKVTPEVMLHLMAAGVELKPYDDFLSEVKSLSAEGSKLWLDTSSVNAAIVTTYWSAYDARSARGSKSTAQNSTEVYRFSPVTMAKALKNGSEIEGMKKAHLRDAAALAEFWAWLEEEVHKKVASTNRSRSGRQVTPILSKAGGILGRKL